MKLLGYLNGSWIEKIFILIMIRPIVLSWSTARVQLGLWLRH